MTDGVRRACKNRPIAPEQVEILVDDLEAAIWKPGVAEIGTQDLGLALLDRLRHLDEVAYVRFASVYKDFQEVTDFEREVGLLLQKKTPPKAQVSLPLA